MRAIKINVWNLPVMDTLFTKGTRRCKSRCVALLMKALVVGWVLCYVSALPARAQEAHARISERMAMMSTGGEWTERGEHTVQDEGPHLFPLSEYSMPALYQQISLQAEDLTVEEALQRVAAEAGFRLSYGSETVDIGKTVTLHYQQTPVRRVLQNIVGGTDLVLLLSRSGQLVVKEQVGPPVPSVQAPPLHMQVQLSPMELSPPQSIPLRLSVGVITGTVVDGATGASLPGANVVVVGTQQGAITDAEGRYEITGLEPGRYAVRATFIGYSSQTREGIQVRDGEATTVDFSLEPSTELLDEVVVVGYGSARRGDLTGSVSSVSAADLQDAVASSFDQALQGRVAGAMVVRNSGKPGGDVSIQVRGLSTLNTGSSEPLYVIDGVPISGDSENSITNPLSTLNPRDIESVDILKDASAAAIYGSRASNGVVLITTKRGEEGDIRVDYGASTGMQQLPKKVDVMNLQQYSRFVSTRADIVGYNNQPQLSNPDLLGEGTDWQEALFRNAYMTDHTLAVSGGDERTQFRLSGGYMYQEGIAIESNFNRYSMRVNLDNQSTGWLKVGANLNLSRTSEDVNVSSDDLINLAIRQTPDIPVQTPDGSWGGPSEAEFTLDNPVGLAQLNTNQQMRSQAVGGVYANVDLLNNLTLNNELNGTFSFQKNDVFNPTYEFGARSNDQSEGSRQSSNGMFWQIRNYLNYVNAYGGFDVEAMGGHEVQVNRWEGLNGSRRSFPSNSVQELAAGDAESANNNSWAGSHSIESFYGRVNLAYDDRYLLTGNFRTDATSNFSSQNRWGYFPSVSAAWKLTNEPYLQGLGVLDLFDQFKLRGGYGFVGNQDIGGYLYGDTYAVLPTQWGSGVRASNLGNPTLKWESTESLSVGLDASVLDERVNLTVDVYRKRVKDLLLQVPLPLYSGTSGTGSITAPFDNIGSLENRGLELALNTVNLQGTFRWESNVVFSMNRNEVTALRGEGDILDRQIEFFDTASRTVVGEPAGQFYGYVVEGLFQSEEELQNHALPEGNTIHETQGTWIGDVKFKDLNGDGVIDDEDRTFIGNPTPDFQYGMTNRFGYGGFDLSVFVNGNYGNDILNQVRRQNEDPAGDHGMLESVFDYARIGRIDPEGTDDLSNLEVTNPETTVPRITDTDPNNNQRISTRFVEDGSYLRIQNITLGYTLPPDLTRRFNLRNLRVYVTAENVHTFTSYSGYDPEVGAVMSGAARDTGQASDPLLRGIDVGRYPTPRTFTFGVNVGL